MKRFLIITAVLALLLGASIAHKEVVDDSVIASPADEVVSTLTPESNPDYITFPNIPKEEEYQGEKDFAYCNI